MKRTFMGFVLFITLIIPLIGFAATPHVCTDPNTYIYADNWPQLSRLSKIQQTLATFASKLKDNDHYELCFQMSELPITAISGDAALIFEAINAQYDVYIVGLKLKSSVVSDKPILKIINDSTHNVVIRDASISNMKNGIKIQGAGVTKVITSIITGDSSKTLPCISVNSDGAVLDGITATGCSDGVAIHANNVKILNKSLIKENKIGIHVYDSFVGTDIQSSRIFANNDGDNNNLWRNDGVRVEGGVPFAPSFHDVQANKWVDVADSEDVYDYQDRPAYIMVQIPENEKNDAAIEFLISDDTYKQAADLIKVPNQLYEQFLRVPIDPAQLKQGPIKIDLPPEAYNKALVAIYTDPELGTTGILRQFSKKLGWIAIVATPYDIPTQTSGVTEASAEAQGEIEEKKNEAEGSGMGGEGGVSEGSGGPNIVSAAAGPGGGCGGGASLLGDQVSMINLAADLWWLLFTIGLIASLRAVTVRIPRRK